MQERSTSVSQSAANNELLTISEVAEILRLPLATLRYWRHLGTGPASFKIGRHVMYAAEDLRDWINTQRGDDGPHAA